MATLKELNERRWKEMRIPAAKGPQFEAVAKRLMAAKARYQAVEKLTGVPWQFIAVTHEREGSQKWTTYLGNGQSLTRKTTIVPKGRGPFKSWEAGAVDALVNCGPYAAKNKDWSIGGTLEMLEKYNGLGYAKRGLPSPYVWAGTNQYIKGKYVADGVFDANHVDKQLGCAGLLKFMGWKNDKVTPPVIAGTTGGAAGTAVAFSYWDWIVAHPYISIAGLAATIALVWWVVHSVKNSK